VQLLQQVMPSFFLLELPIGLRAMALARSVGKRDCYGGCNSIDLRTMHTGEHSQAASVCHS
jgi:hypothetical protein